MKNIIPLTIVLFTALVSCKSDVSVEDRLYSCLHDKFAAKSINLEKTLDTLEVLFINEGLLKSTSSNDYRHYYQTNIDTGMVLTLHDDYLIKLSKKIKLSLNDLEHCAFSEIDSSQLDQSKYGKISAMIDSLVHSTGQISGSTLATAHLTHLSSNDFEHPFYKANILLSLQFLYFDKYLNSVNH